MSRRAPFPRILLAPLIASLTLVAAACGTPAARPSPVGDAPLDEQAVRLLLTLADLEAVGAQTDGLEPRVEDLRALAEAVDAEQVKEIRSWYGLHFERAAPASGLSLTVLDFDSAERAQTQLDVIESGPAFDPMAEPIGDRSASAGPSGGVGAAVAFVDGRRLVTLHSIAVGGAEALVAPAQLEELARLVEERL